VATVDAKLLAALEPLADPPTLLKALHEQFGARMAVGTSGQLTGGVILALCARAGFKPRVFTNDTGRLFPETLALFDRLEKKFDLSIERFGPDPDILAEMVSKYGEHLFFDSKERQELCCRVRKVLPNDRALRALDVWVTGLRADQSPGRAQTPRLQIIDHQEDGRTRPILKVAPLVDWTEERLRAASKEFGVPVHALLEKKLPGGYYYESLGCVICTTPIGPSEPRRAGRWRWFNASDDKKECGLHGDIPPAGLKDPE